MLIFILQTLAGILAGGTSLTSTEQVDFSHPANRREEATGPMLNLYVYDIRESKQAQHSGRQVTRKKTGILQPGSVNWSPNWFDISMLLTAWDRTALGEQHLLTEVLTLLLRHRALREEFLLPELRDYGNLSMTVGLDRIALECSECSITTGGLSFGHGTIRVRSDCRTASLGANY